VLDLPCVLRAVNRIGATYHA